MTRPTIALLTDFGLADTYVGTMKGAMLAVCGELAVVDLTHDVPPHDVALGSVLLAAAVPYFPAGTVFVAVVDPGVGSSRRGIAGAAGAYLFVGPDNGVLAAAIDQCGFRAMVSLDTPRYARHPVSRTFEGRDRFGPAAAWLASGVPLEELGSPIRDYQRVDWPRPLVGEGRVVGAVWFADRFGNLVTNVRAEDLEVAGIGHGTARVGTAGDIPVVGTYADVGRGELCAVCGSLGFLECSVREGSAATLLAAGRGVPVEVVGRSV